MYVYFSPKVSEIGNELSLTQSSMKPKNLNQYFCPVSLQSLGCNYCKCHGNKRSGFHSDSSHCRNSITWSKNYLSVPCYVHLNPACSFHRRAAANTMLLHALSLLTPGLANQVFIQSPPLWSLNTRARCCNPRNSIFFFSRDLTLNSMYKGRECGVTGLLQSALRLHSVSNTTRRIAAAIHQ